VLNVELLNVASTGSANEIEIINTLGQALINEKISIQHSSFNIQNFPSGIYFVKVLEGNKVIATQKIIKE